MPELTRAEIIKQDKVSEQSFNCKAQAARDQANYLRNQANEFDEQAKRYKECAQIAREHWMELENGE